MLKERDDAGRGADELFRRNVHILNLFARMLLVFALVAAHDRRTDKTAVLIERGVGLRDDVLLLLVGG